jgi:uncharacterized membrane protein YphA (DoxX/SURF4 family)
MNKPKLEKALWHAARIASAGLWLVAAMGKLKDPVKFMGGIAEYGIVPGFAVPLAAVTMPGIELLLGLALLAGRQVRAAAMLANLLMLVFMAAMASAMARGLELDCSCFDLLNFGPSIVGWKTIGRDVVMMAPTVWLALWEKPKG